MAAKQIIFDSNYRPALWDSPQQAREHLEAILPMSDLALPTLQDEHALWGIQSVEECLALYTDKGVAELVIKSEDLSAHAFTASAQESQQAPAISATDTTGAGDAFNAGYISARYSGADLASSLSNAHALAGKVVQQRGAILPLN